MQYQQALLMFTLVLLGASYAIFRKRPRIFKILVLSTILAYILAAFFPYLLLILSLKAIIIIYDCIILIVVIIVERRLFSNKKETTGGQAPFKKDNLQAFLEDKRLMEEIDQSVTLPEGIVAELDEVNTTDPYAMEPVGDVQADSGQKLELPLKITAAEERMIDEVVTEVMAENQLQEAELLVAAVSAELEVNERLEVILPVDEAVTETDTEAIPETVSPETAAGTPEMTETPGMPDENELISGSEALFVEISEDQVEPLYREDAIETLVSYEEREQVGLIIYEYEPVKKTDPVMSGVEPLFIEVEDELPTPIPMQQFEEEAAAGTDHTEEVILAELEEAAVILDIKTVSDDKLLNNSAEVEKETAYDIFEPLILAAFTAKNQNDLPEAISNFEQILSLHPPGELAYLVFDELEGLYQKID